MGFVGGSGRWWRKLFGEGGGGQGSPREIVEISVSPSRFSASLLPSVNGEEKLPAACLTFLVPPYPEVALRGGGKDLWAWQTG